MRPGHFCPGNPDLRGDRGRREHASMRPGHFCPGNQSAAFGEWLAGVLQ